MVAFPSKDGDATVALPAVSSAKLRSILWSRSDSSVKLPAPLLGEKPSITPALTVFSSSFCASIRPRVVSILYNMVRISCTSKGSFVSADAMGITGFPIPTRTPYSYITFGFNPVKSAIQRSSCFRCAIIDSEILPTPDSWSERMMLSSLNPAKRKAGITR